MQTFVVCYNFSENRAQRLLVLRVRASFTLCTNLHSAHFLCGPCSVCATFPLMCTQPFTPGVVLGLALLLPDLPAMCALFCDTTVSSSFCLSSPGPCNAILPWKRVQCGEPGMTKAACEKTDCCYDDTLNNSPSCYKKMF